MNHLQFEKDALKENAKMLKVLYVENHAGTRLKLSRMLKRYFGDVFVTTYADNGLKLFENGHFNLIIVSASLPDMFVSDVCKNIKDIAPKKPIVIVSKDKHPDEIIELINIGISGYITTPLDEDNVLHILSRIVLEISDLEMIYYFQDSIFEDYNIPDTPSSQKEDLGKLELSLESEKENEVVHDLLDKDNIELLLTKYEKVNAADFLETYPIDLHLTGDTLFSLTEDIELHINKFINEPSKESAAVVAREFRKFVEILHPITVFSNISFAINKLAMIFESLDYTKSYKEYYDILLAIAETLMHWCENIFINSDVEDIHYLDKQFLADTLRLENLFRRDMSEID